MGSFSDPSVRLEDECFPQRLPHIHDISYEISRNQLFLGMVSSVYCIICLVV